MENKIAAFQQGESGASASGATGKETGETPEVKEEEPELDAAEQVLYNALDAWRNHRANEEGIAPYIIAKNSWLKQIVKMRPTTPKDLHEIIGFGDRRVTKYGRDIVAIVHQAHHGSD